jgi:2-oxoglutarate dehydrogenase E2 component (dihydrolipoamide succinyltransferase)
MPIELKVPNVGESITEVQIGEWRKSEGDFAKENESLVEIETDKATVELPAPVNGLLSKVLKKQGERATVGEVIAYFEERAEAPASDGSAKPEAKSTAAPSSAPQRARVHEAAPASQPTASPFVMPAAERALATSGVRREEVQATGPGGRMLKEDVQRAVEAPRKEVTVAPRREEPVREPIAVARAAPGDRTEKVVPMSMIRRRIAERLVEAQQTAALLTTFNEIDMTNLMALRGQHKEGFQKRYGVKLGYTSFFVKAAVDSLAAFPAINAEIRGDDIIYHNYYDIGIAVGGGKGLVVPVLRDADRMGFAQIELAVADLARRAQENKLELHELQGGTFTISNGGVYGSLLSTPIVNPPQSGILGLHAIQDRPMAIEGQVVIRPMMYVALTYDHRIVDGREAVTFLRRVKEVIEDPTRLLLEV